MTSPHLEAQWGVIGSLLIDSRVAGLVFHGTRETDFSGELRTLYRAAHKLFLAGRPIDPVTVKALVGEEYTPLLLQLMDITPTAANVEEYIRACVEQSTLSQLKGLAQSLQEAITLEDAQSLLAKMNQVAGGRSTVRKVTMEQGLSDFYDRQGKEPKLLPWGMSELEKTFLMELGGDFVVMGGYPSAGKTAFSLQLAWNQAKTLRVGYFSLETKPEKLMDRLVAAVCHVDFGLIKRHELSDQDWESCSAWAYAFEERNLEIIQAGGLSATDIRALSLAGRYDVIYVDYLQLIAPDDRRRSDVEQIAQISKDLHTMAQTTGITVCALSQLSRPDKSGAQEKAPGLHSLKQSGQIEQDADGVLLLYKKQPDEPKSLRCLKIAKNKEGQAGGILYLQLDGAHQRFQPIKDEPQPEPVPTTPSATQTSFFELPGSVPVPFAQ